MSDTIQVHKVCLTMTDLNKRKQTVHKMLNPLVDKAEDLFVHPRANKEEFVLAVTQRHGLQNLDPTNWKFRTKVTDLYASYYERWMRFYNEDEEFWYMDRAYLHFYKIDKQERSYTEFLLLHCDPNEKREHAIYKQSPHLHLVNAPEPWPHAHIALNLNYIEPMLKDAIALTASLSFAIIMLKEQVLDRM